MSTEFVVFAVVVVFLLYWIASNVHAIAKRGERHPAPEERALNWRESWILSKRPDHVGATDKEWMAWHRKYKDKIDTKYFMPERFHDL